MFRTKLASIALASGALLVGGGPGAPSAAAAPKRHGGGAGETLVTGRLDTSGYTVVALGTNGKMTWSKARSFSLPIPAPQYTLQLINRRGVYAGPVVVGGSGNRVIVGLRGPVRLGPIDLAASKGYAHVSRRVPATSLVRSRWAWANHGVPIGTGRNLGLVKSPTKGAGPGGPGGDSDRSGIPNAFDIASGGNGIINSLVPRFSLKSARRADPIAHTAAGGGPPAWASELSLPVSGTANADAAGVSQAEIDSTLAASLNLRLLNLPAADTIELDCNGLSYCSRGAGLLGTFAGSVTKEFSLFPHAGSAQIGSGDVITALSTAGGATKQTPTTVNFVFTTVPAIAAYADSTGQSRSVSYPDAAGIGTQSNPIKVAAGPNGDVVVRFTLYRPQRAGIAGAGEAAYMDIGHLWYAFDAPPAPAPAPEQSAVGATTPPHCSRASYLATSPTLTAVDGASVQSRFGSPPGTGMLVDFAGDQPASPSNTISFTVDVSACMAQKGESLPVGRPTPFDISANSQSSTDHADQTFWLERTP